MLRSLKNAWWTVLVIGRDIYNMFFKKLPPSIPYVISSITVISIYCSKVLGFRTAYCFWKANGAFAFDSNTQN